jgi:hypothetical protein
VSGAVPPDSELPSLVRRYLERAVPPDRPPPSHVRITQKGEMWQKPGARSIRFAAVQRLAVDRVAFSWRARFPMLGPIAIKVVDEYSGGEGRLEARVLGLPVLRQRGPETAIGEALRYLAELPWVPYAMTQNRELEWRSLDERSVEVSSQVGREPIAVTLHFDEAGDIVRAACPARPRQVGKSWVPTPWAGEFGDYGALGGVRIPTSAKVRWEPQSAPFTYWQGNVSSLELDPGP